MWFQGDYDRLPCRISSAFLNPGNWIDYSHHYFTPGWDYLAAVCTEWNTGQITVTGQLTCQDISHSAQSPKGGKAGRDHLGLFFSWNILIFIPLASTVCACVLTNNRDHKQGSKLDFDWVTSPRPPPTEINVESGSEAHVECFATDFTRRGSRAQV